MLKDFTEKNLRRPYAESETELVTAQKLFEKQKIMRAQGIIWAYRTLCELLRLRSTFGLSQPYSRSPLSLAKRALELTEQGATANVREGLPRDVVSAHWFMGAAHRVAGEYDEAEFHLHKALERCRHINLVDHEADILIDLARLRAATNAPGEAKNLAEEALLITERSGYALQGADAHLELAKLALNIGDKTTAKTHASDALRLATCDGPPDYTYHAAYTEATALLEQFET